MDKDKIMHLLKKIRMKQPIGIELLKMDDVNSKRNIHKYADMEIINNLDSYYFYGNKYMILLSLAIIAYDFYDGNFWRYIEETYVKSFRINKHKAQNTIYSVLNDYNLYFNNTRPIDTAIMISIVPAHYLKNYAEFMYDIFKHNFDYYLPNKDVVYSELQHVFKYLSTVLNDHTNELDINIQNNKKTYKLIQATKTIIKNYNCHDSLIKYSMVILDSIERCYNQNSTNSFLDNEVASLNMYRRFPINEKELIYKPKERSGKPYFYLDGDKLYLKFPQFRFDYNMDSPRVRVILDNHVIYDERIVLINIIGGMRTKSFSINVKNEFKQMEILIYNNDKSFDFFDYIFEPMFFDSNFNYINNIDRYRNNEIYLLDNEIIENQKKYLYNVAGFRLYQIETIEKNNCIMTSKGFVYIGYDSIKQGIIGQRIKNLTISRNSKIYETYFNVDYIKWECQINKRDFTIFINGKREKLEEKLVVKKSSNGYVYEIFAAELQVFSKSNFYVFEVLNNDKRIFKLNFFIIKNFEIVKTDTEYDFKLKSDLNFINGTINLFNDTPVTINIRDAQFDAYVVIDKVIYNYDIKWNEITENTEHLWIKDIKTLKIKGFTSNEIVVNIYNENGEFIGNLNVMKDEFNVYEIRKEYLLNYSSHQYIELEVNNIYLRIYFTPTILNKNTMIKLYPHTGEVEIIPNIVGSAQFTLDIFDSNNNKIYSDKLHPYNIIKDFESFSYYTFKIHDNTMFFNNSADFFIKYFIYKFEDFVDNKFDIIQIKKEQYVNYDSDPILSYINSKYKIRIIEYNLNRFKGYIYYETKSNKRIGFDFNPVTLTLTDYITSSRLWFECADKDNEPLSLSNDKRNFIINSREWNGNSPTVFDICLDVRS